MHTRKPSSARLCLLNARAHQLRSALTPSERRLWGAVSGRRLGVSFRRQVVIGEFIVDFLAPAQRLVVEVDGGYHAARRRADARRDAVLRHMGYRVLRLESEFVMRGLEAALARIVAALQG